MRLKQSVLEEKKAVCLGTPLDDPVVTTLLQKQGAQVQSLVRKLVPTCRN